MPSARLIALLLAVPLPGEPAGAQVTARIDSIFAALNSSTTPGCQLAVSQRGQLVLERAWGMSDIERGVAMTPLSIFHVASVSKQFTAMAVLLLADRGRLSLDDEVRRYVPELGAFASRITIRHLLTHTSGLRDQWDLLGLAGWRNGDLYSQEDVLRIVFGQRSLNFQPGSEALYSNTGFTLAALIVERVSGERMQVFFEREIARPLGLSRTHVHDHYGMMVPGRTSAYSMIPGGGWRVSEPTYSTYGATNLFSTATDLVRWAANFDSARVGSRASIASMLSPTILTTGDTSAYGLGVSLAPYRGTRSIGHNGNDAGYRADLVHFPDHRLAVATLCNTDAVDPTALGRRVADLFLPEPPAATAPVSAASRPQATAIAPPTPDEMRQLAGVYHNPATDEVRRVEVRDAQLIYARGPGFVLTRVDQRRYSLPFGAIIEFPPHPNSLPQKMVVHQPPGVGPALTYEQRRLPTATRAALAILEGVYVSPELQTMYTVSVSDSGLVIEHLRRERVLLRPVFADAFDTAGYIAMVRFERNANGTPSALTVTTPRARRVRFHRLAVPR